MQEVRGTYSIRLTYLEAAEIAQERLESSIRSRITEFDIAARTGRTDADQERTRALDLSNLTSYETALANWTADKVRIQPLINKLKISLEAAEITSDLAKAKKFRRWAEEIEKIKVRMERETMEMIRFNPAQAETAKNRHVAEKIQNRHGARRRRDASRGILHFVFRESGMS